MDKIYYILHIPTGLSVVTRDNENNRVSAYLLTEIYSDRDILASDFELKTFVTIEQANLYLENYSCILDLAVDIPWYRSIDHSLLAATELKEQFLSEFCVVKKKI